MSYIHEDISLAFITSCKVKPSDQFINNVCTRIAYNHYMHVTCILIFYILPDSA